ncbi:MAG: RDD family protein [Candidatus Omnitrophica bacterium]|nr:RDD family protein [Candidatus Omnitrophota bacterium]
MSDVTLFALLILIIVVFGVVVYFILREDKKQNSPGATLRNQEGSMEQKLKCSQCGLDFPASEMITYENRYVCGGCKTSFVQRLREGVSLSATTHFGGFWIRLGAEFIDIILILIIDWGIKLIINLFLPVMVQAHGKPAFGPGYWIYMLVNLSLSFFYFTWFIAKYGATLGKMACGIKVVGADGSNIGYGRAVGRYFSKFLSGIILCIGYFMIGSDSEKRALHDRICNTRVVYK